MWFKHSDTVCGDHSKSLQSCVVNIQLRQRFWEVETWFCSWTCWPTNPKQRRSVPQKLGHPEDTLTQSHTYSAWEEQCVLTERKHKPPIFFNLKKDERACKRRNKKGQGEDRVRKSFSDFVLLMSLFSCEVLTTPIAGTQARLHTSSSDDCARQISPTSMSACCVPLICFWARVYLSVNIITVDVCMCICVCIRVYLCLCLSAWGWFSHD